MKAPEDGSARAREPQQAATWGGPGFRARQASHADDMRAGELWRPCGAGTEVGRLREALISWPSDRLVEIDDPDAWLMLERPHLLKIRAQAEAVATALDKLGVLVHIHRAGAPPPNYLFLRDLAMMTPEGAILGRPAAVVRAGEARHMGAVLAGLGVPILRTITGTACFEGADALWLRPDVVLVGLGRRTNAAGHQAVSDVLAGQGVQTQAVQLPPDTQHLLGVMVPVDTDLVVVHGGRVTDEMRDALESHGWRLLVLPPTDEVVHQRAMNLVTIRPGQVLMPAGCPETQEALEAAGLETHTVDVSEYVKAGGALGCLTATLRRDAP
jgi:N-dimethylarginine dimethylaminohydrolase